MRSEIDAYIREHRVKYTTDALRRQLVEAGHDPSEVDEALREAEGTATRQGSGAADFALILYAAGAVVGALGALLIVSLSGVGGAQLNALLFIAVYAIAYLGLGYVVVRLVRAAGSAFDIHGAGAVVLSIVLVPVFGLLMFGTCIAASNLATA